MRYARQENFIDIIDKLKKAVLEIDDICGYFYEYDRSYLVRRSKLVKSMKRMVMFIQLRRKEVKLSRKKNAELERLRLKYAGEANHIVNVKK